jgi:hypothetical protein
MKFMEIKGIIRKEYFNEVPVGGIFSCVEKVYIKTSTALEAYHNAVCLGDGLHKNFDDVDQVIHYPCAIIHLKGADNDC